MLQSVKKAKNCFGLKKFYFVFFLAKYVSQDSRSCHIKLWDNSFIPVPKKLDIIGDISSI